MVEELTKCPNCKRRTLVREGQELVCSQCGGHFPAPQEGPSSSPSSPSSPKRAHILERHQFYEKNKKEIIRDYEAKGRQETAEKWKIPWPNLYQLLRRWGIIKKRVDAKANKTSKHGYYEGNKQEIIKDLLALGRQPAREKWKISSSTLFTLEKRWLTADQKASLDTFAPSLPPSGPASNPNGLPPFPEFSSSWQVAVQLKWLEVYGQLVAQKQGGDACVK